MSLPFLDPFSFVLQHDDSVRKATPEFVAEYDLWNHKSKSNCLHQALLHLILFRKWNFIQTEIPNDLKMHLHHTYKHLSVFQKQEQEQEPDWSWSELFVPKEPCLIWQTTLKAFLGAQTYY